MDLQYLSNIIKSSLRRDFWGRLQQVFMNRILIDSVLTSPPVQAFYSGIFPESRSGKAILLVVLMVLPHLLIVFLYRLKAQRRIMGMATNQLRLAFK